MIEKVNKFPYPATGNPGPDECAQGEVPAVLEGEPQSGDIVRVTEGDRVSYYRHTVLEESAPAPARVETILAFKRRFTAAERITIRGSTNPVVIDFMDLLASATAVDFADTDLINGVNYLEAQSLIAEGRAAEILEQE